MLSQEVIKLLEYSRWTDPTDLYIGDIIEYDMSDGGFSIIQEEELLPPKEIARLMELSKGLDRNVAVGKLRYSKNPEFRDIGKTLETLFKKYRIIFGDINNLEVSDIFSIKRDAIFLKRFVDNTRIGKFINFREKHQYNIYFLLGKDELITNLESRHKTYEVYYNTYTDDIAIKGIRDELIDRYHMNGIIKIIKRYLKYIVKFDFEGATKYIVGVIDDYRFLRLPIEMYRDFNDGSSYRVQLEGKEFEMDTLDMSYMEYVDIRYNVNHILVPMLNMASLGISKNG